MSKWQQYERWAHGKEYWSIFSKHDCPRCSGEIEENDVILPCGLKSPMLLWEDTF